MGNPAPELEIRTLAAWRDWLAEHHASAGSHWLIHYKKHTAFYVPFGALVDEALCWGWIDSAVRKVDADRLKHLMSPRRPGSAWSRVNKDKVARLRAAGRMQPAGEAAIARAEADGSWSFLDDVDRLIVPDDLAASFAAHPGSAKTWEGFPPSVKRGILEWIKMAKRPETRARRITEIADKAARGKRGGPAA